MRAWEKRTNPRTRTLVCMGHKTVDDGLVAEQAEGREASAVPEKAVIKYGSLGPVYTCDFYRFLSSCDCFATSFRIGFNTHFIA